MKNCIRTSSYSLYENSQIRKKNLYQFSKQKPYKKIMKQNQTTTDGEIRSIDNTVNDIIKMFRGTIVDVSSENNKSDEEAALFLYHTENNMMKRESIFLFSDL